MRLKPRPRSYPTLSLAPLIDIVFNLLLFVVLSARFGEDERLDVDVPSASAGRPAEVDALFVELDARGTVWLMGKPTEPKGLLDELLTARRHYGRMVLVADRQIGLQHAVDVISAAKLAGFETVAVATRPPEIPK